MRTVLGVPSGDKPVPSYELRCQTDAHHYDRIVLNICVSFLTLYFEDGLAPESLLAPCVLCEYKVIVVMSFVVYVAMQSHREVSTHNGPIFKAKTLIPNRAHFS